MSKFPFSLKFLHLDNIEWHLDELRTNNIQNKVQKFYSGTESAYWVDGRYSVKKSPAKLK